MKNNSDKIEKKINCSDTELVINKTGEDYSYSIQSDTDGKVKKNKTRNKNNDNSGEISYTQELLRKTIHLCSLSIPITYIFVDQITALYILIPMALFFIVMDILTKKVKVFRDIYKRYFGKMLRKHEKKTKKIFLNGASWVLISAVLVVLVFPKILAITGFTILIISDICAALIGRKFGKTPLFNKSWEGTSAFIVSAMLVVSVYTYLFSAPWTFWAFGLLGAVVAGFAEAASKVLKVDDNLSIPISFGIIAWIGGIIAANMGVPYLFLL